MPAGFAGPGVDLRGEDAERVMAAAKPVEAWLLAREPGVVLRSLSVDRGRMRVLVTLEAVSPGERPRVIRFDPPHGSELVEAARDAEQVIAAACAIKIAARA